jgi:hypothetical protein
MMNNAIKVTLANRPKNLFILYVCTEEEEKKKPPPYGKRLLSSSLFSRQGLKT